MEVKNINIKDLEINKGQIEGLPKNPRFIKDERFKALKKSIEDAPEMLSLRELIVYPFGGKFIIIAGNMRYRACKELGYKEIPCKVLDDGTDVKKLREYAIKDNIAFGADDFDLLANEWDINELTDWGLDTYGYNVNENYDDLFENIETQKEKEHQFKIEILIPEEKSELKEEIFKKVKKALVEYNFINFK